MLKIFLTSKEGTHTEQFKKYIFFLFMSIYIFSSFPISQCWHTFDGKAFILSFKLEIIISSFNEIASNESLITIKYLNFWGEAKKAPIQRSFNVKISSSLKVFIFFLLFQLVNVKTPLTAKLVFWVLSWIY